MILGDADSSPNIIAYEVLSGIFSFQMSGICAHCTSHAGFCTRDVSVAGSVSAVFFVFFGSLQGVLHRLYADISPFECVGCFVKVVE